MNIKSAFMIFASCLGMVMGEITDVYSQPNDWQLHEVKSGETLWGLYKKFEVDVAEIKRINSLASNDIYVGQVLKIRLIRLGATGGGQADLFNERALTEQQRLDFFAQNKLRANNGIKYTANPKIRGNDVGWITHEVQQGESLWSLTKKYGVSASEIKSINGLKSDLIEVEQVLFIKPHENPFQLNGIAGLRATSVAQPIKDVEGPIQLNRIAGSRRISIDEPSIGNASVFGDRYIRTTETWIIHTVQSGETLFSIYKKYQVSIDEIKRINKLTNNRIAVGQKLRIKPH